MGPLTACRKRGDPQAQNSFCNNRTTVGFYWADMCTDGCKSKGGKNRADLGTSLSWRHWEPHRLDKVLHGAVHINFKNK